MYPGNKNPDILTMFKISGKKISELTYPGLKGS